jgi:hypothetical protein
VNQSRPRRLARDGEMLDASASGGDGKRAAADDPPIPSGSDTSVVPLAVSSLTPAQRNA